MLESHRIEEIAMASSTASGVAPPVVQPGPAVHDFDFQTGTWRVRHRRLTERLVGSDTWEEFDGTTTAWPILGGAGNVEGNVLELPAGTYRAAALRTYQRAIYVVSGAVDILGTAVHARQLAPLVPPAVAAMTATEAAHVMLLGTPLMIGSRYSWGYPACPDLDDQVKVAELLEIDRIGVALTEEFHLVPEQSTSAIIVPHPEAKYFVA